MAVKIQGVTVIDNSRNILNVASANVNLVTSNSVTSNTVTAEVVTVNSLKDTSGRTLKILDSANNVLWGE